MSKYLVLVSGSQMLEDIKQAKDDYLSFEDAAAEVSRFLSFLRCSQVPLTNPDQYLIDCPDRLYLGPPNSYGPLPRWNRSNSLDKKHCRSFF